MFSVYCSVSALACSFEFVVVGGSQRLLSLNPTTVLVVVVVGVVVVIGL